MGARMAALKKILGSSASLLKDGTMGAGGLLANAGMQSAKRMGGLTSELGQVGKGVMASGRHAMAGGMNANALKALTHNLGIDAGRTGRAIMSAPGEAALLGGGVAAGGYGAKKGIDALLEQLGLSDDDEDDMPMNPRKHKGY